MNRGSLIAIVETEDRKSEIQKLLPEKVNAIFDTVSSIKEPTISSGKLTREDIAKRINLHVPAEF